MTVTLDIELQEIVIESLIEGLDLANKNFESESNIERGAVVVLNIETGEVEAMVSLPILTQINLLKAFPNLTIQDWIESKLLNNFAIQDCTHLVQSLRLSHIG